MQLNANARTRSDDNENRPVNIEENADLLVVIGDCQNAAKTVNVN